MPARSRLMSGPRSAAHGRMAQRMPGRSLKLLSAGAARGTVHALAPRFHAETGMEIAGTFGPVGAMKEKLLAGDPADVVILTKTLIAELAVAGYIAPDSVADLGRVRTGVAVKQGDAAPSVAGVPALRDALLGATEIYFPDPLRATAGIHFMKVLDGLSVRQALAPRLRPHPSGADAMRAMARAPGGGLLGCTQITEILSTPGVRLIGPLPAEFELATVYSAATCTNASAVDPARRFVTLLAADSTRALRAQLGFEF